MHQLRCISLVFKCVVKEGVAHSHHALFFPWIDVVPQLLEPHPVVWLTRLDNAISEQLVYNIDVVDDVKD